MESIRQYLEGRPTEVGEAVFDKEDDLAVEFVTAAANLRAANYGISQQSLFITKVSSQLYLCAFPSSISSPEHLYWPLKKSWDSTSKGAERVC